MTSSTTVLYGRLADAAAGASLQDLLGHCVVCSSLHFNRSLPADFEGERRQDCGTACVYFPVMVGERAVEAA